jgi:hypothetical protein
MLTATVALVAAGGPLQAQEKKPNSALSVVVVPGDPMA